jgi:hypothetical protein
MSEEGRSIAPTPPNSTPPNSAPIPRFYRRVWFMSLCVILCVPLQLLILWTGPVYRWSKGQYRPIERSSKAILSVIGLFLLSFNLLRLAGGESGSGIPACGEEAAIDGLKRAIGQSPAGKTLGVEVLDVEESRELMWSETQQLRLCGARALTNAGTRWVRYQIRWADPDRQTWYMEAEIP